MGRNTCNNGQAKWPVASLNAGKETFHKYAVRMKTVSFVSQSRFRLGACSLIETCSSPWFET